MKKYIIGAVFGAILATSFSAHADIVSMIGKVVDGAFPVKVNGATVSQQAIVIEGTSYLPVRAMSDAMGMDVSFNADMGIELKSKGVNNVSAAPSDNAKKQLERSNKILDLTKKSTDLMNQLNKLNGDLFPYEHDNILEDGSYGKKPHDSAYEGTAPKRDAVKQELDDVNKQIQDAVKENNDIANGVMPQP